MRIAAQKLDDHPRSMHVARAILINKISDTPDRSARNQRDKYKDDGDSHERDLAIKDFVFFCSDLIYCAIVGGRALK